MYAAAKCLLSAAVPASSALAHLDTNRALLPSCRLSSQMISKSPLGASSFAHIKKAVAALVDKGIMREKSGGGFDLDPSKRKTLLAKFDEHMYESSSSSPQTATKKKPTKTIAKTSAKKPKAAAAAKKAAKTKTNKEADDTDEGGAQEAEAEEAEAEEAEAEEAEAEAEEAEAGEEAMHE